MLLTAYAFQVILAPYVHANVYSAMSWEVEGTDQFSQWYDGLKAEEQDHINAAVDLLTERGPALGRPLVGEIDQSREPGEHIKNLKELRPLGETIRILFVFDPRRTAILLTGGDKAGDWKAWYREAIPEAERLYRVYLEELRREGLLPQTKK
jgi:hypothetical protein